MQFMLMIYENPEDFEGRSEGETPPHMGAYAAYSAALRDGRALSGGAALHPPQTATTIRVRDGRRQVQDGPFPDTKEQLGGYYLLDAPDLDAALDWAAKCPAASYGTVEVRPVWFVNPGA